MGAVPGPHRGSERRMLKGAQDLDALDFREEIEESIDAVPQL